MKTCHKFKPNHSSESFFGIFHSYIQSGEIIWLMWFIGSERLKNLICRSIDIDVAVNLDYSWTLSGDSQEPKLGGPRTVGDSFKPLGESKIVTWTRPSHLTNQNRIKRMTKNTSVVNILFYTIKLYSTQTRINNSSENSKVWNMIKSLKREWR